jgi:2',3'-cyclic-nucleotide 2'-phosphodiesterase (5'-nucleotidase family)
VGHLCRQELETLAQRVADLEIQFMGSGHCNELFAETVGATTLVGGGYHLTSFARADFVFDTAADTVLEAGAETFRNEPGATPDTTVAAIVEEWRARTDEELEVVIGYSDHGLQRRSDEMLALVTESWLWAYPTADISITNEGGFRAALAPGEITFADVVGMLPFNNVLVEVELRGEALLQVLARGDAAVGGAHLGIGEWILEDTGQPIQRDEVYRVLVNDFMYAGGDDYTLLAQLDPDAYNTAIDWRQPVIDWIVAQASSPEMPLDGAFEALDE